MLYLTIGFILDFRNTSLEQSGHILCFGDLHKYMFLDDQDGLYLNMMVVAGPSFGSLRMPRGAFGTPLGASRVPSGASHGDTRRSGREEHTEFTLWGGISAPPSLHVFWVEGLSQYTRRKSLQHSIHNWFNQKGGRSKINGPRLIFERPPF